MLAFMLTFAVALTAMLAVYWAFLVRPEAAEHAALKRRMRDGERRAQQVSDATLIKPEERLSAIPMVDRLLKASGQVIAPIQQRVTLSGMKITPATLLMACACSASIVFAIVTLTLRQRWLGLLLGLLAAFVPMAYVNYRARKRLLLFEEQFPEAIDLIARALRAGHAFTTGLSIVSEEAPEPIASEFRQLYEEQNFGRPIPEAMRALAERVPLLDARFFATAVLTQRESGGNLAAILDNISAVIRDRFKVKRQVRVVTAHARLTGWILICEPPLLALALVLVIPGHFGKLSSDPLGVGLIALAIVLQTTGTLIIRKLVNIEY
jgi:tight adherence protein B